MDYLYFAVFSVIAWQDFRKKEIASDMLLLLWGLALAGTVFHLQSQGSGVEAVKIAAGILLSVIYAKYGRDFSLGKGDILILLWLAACLPVMEMLQILTYGFFLLWIAAIVARLRGKSGLVLPVMPFLWIGYGMAIVLQEAI